ncbi:MAG TPA: hypothetical protein PK916_16935 [Bacteroidota bacterium]|nr:hypothetical protein [Bacteroidota bacterium]
MNDVLNFLQLLITLVSGATVLYLAFVIKNKPERVYVEEAMPMMVEESGCKFENIDAPRQNKIEYYKYENDNSEKFAVFSLEGNIREKVLEQFQLQYSSQGDHVKNGGKISPVVFRSIIGGSGASLALSGTLAGKLFIATANPATLMTLGSGVGSAVMGTGGIVAQAPFVAAAGPLMGVVAPVLIIQTLSTILILKQFEKVNERLNSISHEIERILERTEATFVGELISASNRIASIEEKYNICNGFTDDMMMQLVVLESHINPILERYWLLYRSYELNVSSDYTGVAWKLKDAYYTAMLSVLDLRIDVLKLKYDLQENPGVASSSSQKITRKVDEYIKLYRDITKIPKELKKISRGIEKEIEEMGGLLADLRDRLGLKSKERSRAEEKWQEIREGIDLAKHVKDVIKTNDVVGSMLKQKKLSEDTSLVFWQDEYGAHCYYTSDLILMPEGE